MWKLLQRKSTMSVLSLPPVRSGGLSALSRLWRSEGVRAARRPVAMALAAKGFDDPEITQRIPANQLQVPHPHPHPHAMTSQETAPRKRVPPPRQTEEYARRLLLLKAQHEELSAQRTQIDQTGERQRERVADLEARLQFLRETLDPQSPTPLSTPRVTSPPKTPPPIPFSAVAPSSAKTPTVTFLVPDPAPAATANFARDLSDEETVKLPATTLPRTTPPSDAVPEADYRRAVAEAQHWQELAQDLERQIHTLSQLVRVDSLTGLSNRRSFDEHLPRAVARAKRVHDSVCLLMIDIDHFKRLNDTYGHPAGDAVLRSVASSIASCTRPSDHVARYGGEEFAVVLCDVDSAQAFAVAERIRRQVAQADHCPHKVTVSVGLAEYRPAVSFTAGTHDELLAAADKALYAAKHGGRNCVAVAPGCGVELQLKPR